MVVPVFKLFTLALKSLSKPVSKNLYLFAVHAPTVIDQLLRLLKFDSAKYFKENDSCESRFRKVHKFK